MKKLLLLLLLGIVMLGTSCQKDEVDPFKDKILAIEAPDIAGLGQPVTIKVSMTPPVESSSYELEWSIDPKLADFDEATHTLTRKANGPVTVKVNVKERPELCASKTINPVIATKVVFKKKVYNVELGQPIALEVETIPQGADVDFEWKFNKQIATIDPNTKTATLNQAGATELTVAIKGKPETADTCLIKQPNVIYFFDQAFRKEVLSDFDKNKDGEIQASEIENVKMIHMNGCKIRSLQGIEFFPNLEELYCNYNYIENVDISSNPKLEVFYCSENKLSTIDVSKNPKLRTFKCSENQLSSIDVSKNLNLKDFNCSKNKISTIDISKNIAMEIFQCSENLLSAIDLSSNTNLTDFRCASNKISDVTVSNLPKLKFFDCSGNQLSSIDVSQNKKLEYFYCSKNQLSKLDITNSVDLRYFACFENKITSIDLTKNVSLKEIDCSKNNITNIDISKCINIDSFYCENNSLSSIDFSSNTVLSYIKLSANNISTIDVSKCINLRYILLSNNKLSTIDISKNKRIYEVNFLNNPDLTKILVWKGFAPTSDFKKDDKATFVEVSE